MMKSRIIPITLLSVILMGAAPSSMKVETVKEQLYFVTVRIETLKEDQKGVGTGFIVEYRIDEKRTAKFIVTNKHVVSGATEGSFFFIKAKEGLPELGEKYDLHFDNFESAWYINPDPDIDVAIMPLEGIFKELAERGWKIFYRSINEELAVETKDLKNLDAIEEVIFIGYPNALFDEKNYLPIARRGSTATPVHVNYNGRPNFLIDASVFPGSSGSPVFVVDKRSFTLGDAPPFNNRVYFLGLISAVGSREEKALLEFKDLPKELQPIIRTNQMIDLGVVVKTEAIYATIKSYVDARIRNNTPPQPKK